MSRGLYFLYWSLFGLLLAVGSVSAGQSQWEIDTDLGVGTEIGVSHVFSDGPLPLGSQFYISTTAWTGAAKVDSLAFGALQVNGCTIIEDVTDATQTALDRAIVAKATLQVSGDTCSWRRSVFANDTVQGVVVEVSAVGSISSFEMVDVGQDPSFGGAAFWVPVGAFLGLMVWSLWQGWRLPALASTLGLLTQFFFFESLGTIGGLVLFVLFLWLLYYVRRPKENALSG